MEESDPMNVAVQIILVLVLFADLWAIIGTTLSPTMEFLVRLG